MKHGRPFIKVSRNTLHDNKCEIKQKKRGESEKQSPTTKIESPNPGARFWAWMRFQPELLRLIITIIRGTSPLFPAGKHRPLFAIMSIKLCLLKLLGCLEKVPNI